MPYTTSEQIRGQSTKHFMKNEASAPAQSVEEAKIPDFILQGRYPANEAELNIVTGNGKFPI